MRRSPKFCPFSALTPVVVLLCVIPVRYAFQRYPRPAGAPPGLPCLPWKRAISHEPGPQSQKRLNLHPCKVHTRLYLARMEKNQHSRKKIKLFLTALSPCVLTIKKGMVKMKKLLPLLLSMTLVFSLTACGGENTSSGSNGSSRPSSQLSGPSAQASETPSPQTPSGSEPSAEAALPAAGTGGILITYFSWSGNTQQMAQMIQAETGGTLFEIEPATPYTDDYNQLLDIAQQEQADKVSGIRGEVKEIGFGSQIRSYVMQPYTMVKDHRTNMEISNVNGVMDGNLDPFINAYLSIKP